MKQLHPGCRAICIHPNAMNDPCTLVKWVKAKVVFEFYGELCRSLIDGWLVDFDDGDKGVFEAAFLIPIDDESETAQREAEQCLELTPS